MRSARVSLVLLLAASAAGAQPVKRPPEVLSLLDRTAQAMGVDARGSMSASAQGVFLGLDGSRTAFRFAGSTDGRARWERETAEGTAVTVLTAQGWGYEIRKGRRTGLPLSRLAGSGLEAVPTLAVAAWAASPAHRAEALGPDHAEVGRIGSPGLPAEQAAAAERALRSELRLEPSGGLPQSLLLFLHPGEMRIEAPLELSFWDWREAGGALWAHRVEARLPGSKRLIGTWLFEKVNPNVELSEEDFR